MPLDPSDSTGYILNKWPHDELGPWGAVMVQILILVFVHLHLYPDMYESCDV